MKEELLKGSTEEKMSFIDNGYDFCPTNSPDPEAWGFECQYCGAGKGSLVKHGDNWYECKYCHRVTVIDK